MGAADLSRADALRAQAGWNQTLPDWRRLLDYEPDGCFVAELDGTIAATATTTRYGTAVAWIGMVLVDQAHRRRGIGSALFRHCLNALAGVRSVQLDATPLGQPLYQKFGFECVWNWHRWERAAATKLDLAPSREGGNGCRPWRESDLNQMAALDAAAFGVERTNMLHQLARDSQTLVVEDPSGRIRAFGMLRPGSRADYLGPMVSESFCFAESLIQTLMAHAEARAVFWDIPEANTAATDAARALGFTQQRPLVRMAAGTCPVAGNQTTYYGIADPAIG